MTDPLDDRIWRRVVALIEATHRADAASFRNEFDSWPAELSIQEQRRMELYLRYLLGLHLHRETGGDYSPDRLRETASKVQTTVAALVKADMATLMEVFRDALDVPDPGDTMRGVKVDIIGSVALGALLTDPVTDLAEMRPHLAAYYEKFAADLRALEETG